MSDVSFSIEYAAHTATCTFLLDGDGICRRVVPVSPRAKGTASASRAVGAQYVASLDPTVAGMLAEMPRVGSAMLFARVDDRGRVSLVRTGVVTRFEHHRVEDPFAPAEVKATASTSVETSAPQIPVSTAKPRFSRVPDAIPVSGPPSAGKALRPEELKAADRRTSPFGVSGSGLHARTGEEEAVKPTVSGIAVDSEDATLDDEATIAQHESGWLPKTPEPTRSTMRPPPPPPMSGALLAPRGIPTLRAPSSLTNTDDELDPYAARARASLPLPRPSLPPRVKVAGRKER